MLFINRKLWIVLKRLKNKNILKRKSNDNLILKFLKKNKNKIYNKKNRKTNLSRKVSEKQKKDILIAFNNGINIKEISKTFNFTVPTVKRQLKKILGEDVFFKTKKGTSSENLTSKIPSIVHDDISPTSKAEDQIVPLNNNSFEDKDEDNDKENNASFTLENNFFEITPLDEEIEFTKQKDISSVSLQKINFPKVLYMLVNQNIELEIKLLNEYPAWNFLPDNDQKRMTIEIFADQKLAKSICSKSQKLIKVPNTKVFEIASKVLISKGISRIIFEDNLISL